MSAHSRSHRVPRTLPLAVMVSLMTVGGALAFATSATAATQPIGSQPPPGVTLKTDVTYGSDSGLTLQLDVAMPSGGGTHPALVLVHGGEWVSLTRKVLLPAAEQFAAAGYVSFTIDYSMAEPRYPREVDDVTMAVSWVRQHASEYGVDASRIALLGTSSGGNIAAVSALQAKGTPDSGAHVQALVTWSAPLDLTTLVQNPDDGCSGPTCSMRRVLVPAVERYLGCTLASCPQSYTNASATTYIDGSAPPMLLMNSADEVMPVSQAQGMADKLSSAGVTNQVIIVPGTDHATQYESQAIQPSIDFLNKHDVAGSTHPSGGGSSQPPTTPPPTQPPSRTVPTLPPVSPASGGGPATWMWGIVIGVAAALLLLALGSVIYRSGRRAGFRRPPAP